MKRLSIREARQALSQLDDLLAREGEITITRRGEPIARLLPIESSRSVPSHRALREKGGPMSRPSERLVREDRNSR